LALLEFWETWLPLARKRLQNLNFEWRIEAPGLEGSALQYHKLAIKRCFVLVKKQS